MEFRVGVGEWSWRAQLAVERKSERMDTAYSPRFREEELPADANAIQELRLAVERKSERADTAYSPRFREEELPATANAHCRAQASLSDAANERSAIINLLSPIRMGRPARQGTFRQR